jgi:hypothetical protein
VKVVGENESVIQSSLAGESSQVHNENITKVLLVDGWHTIVPGSFKLYRTGNKLPFIRFDTVLGGNESLGVGGIVHTLEIFPNALHGVAFPKPPEYQPKVAGGFDS